MRTSRLILRMMMPGPMWEGEGGGGGGDGGDGAAAAAAAAAAAGGDKGGGGDGSGGWKPPQGVTIPAEFMGTSAEDTLGKVLGGYSALNTRAEGLRTQLAAKPGAPEKPEAYTFKPADDIAKYFGDVEKHPTMTVARQAAHKHGLSQGQFEGFVNEVYGQLGKSGALAEPFSEQAELDAYGKGAGVDLKTVAQHFTEADTFAKGLIAQLDLPPTLAAAAQAELTALTDTAGGNALIRALAGRLSQNGIRIAGQGYNPGGPISDAELDKMTADPRIDPRNENSTDPAKRFDKALYERYTAGMAERGRKKYGTGRAPA